MLGWTILFFLMALPGAAAAAAGYPTATSLKSVSVVFTLLFLLSVLTRLARSRVR